MAKIAYTPNQLQTFEQEWGVHKNCREWWYATGYLNDEAGNLYSFQYTLLHLNFGICTPKIVMAALTDFQTGRHYYLQRTKLRSNDVVITDNRVECKSVASVEKRAKGMELALHHKDFQLRLHANYGKGAFWHCDNGKLQMALQDEKETTYYYSYTNMPTEGKLTLGGKTFTVKGKTWFDKQGGTYSLWKPQTHWEWFSLRFYDDEEMMLFSFPQSKYQDGTYITAAGTRGRLNDYTLKTTKEITKNGYRWSSGWNLFVPAKKEEQYTIEPIVEGNMNFAYFEQLCHIKNTSGETVGLCFVELLPGVLNKLGGGNDMSKLFKSVEY